MTTPPSSDPAASAAALPLTPPVASAAHGTTAGRRLLGAVVAIAAGAVLTVAAVLTPASEGIGTHEQLSLPPCGWIAIADLPCPTCGMTTAFAHAADGRLLESARTQPLGFLLALGTAMAFIVGFYVVATGSRAIGNVAATLTPRVAWAAGGIAVAAWLYKVASHKGWL